MNLTRPSAFSSTGSYSGIGFAVPSDIVKKVVESIISTGNYAHPYLGIMGVDITPTLAKLFGLKKANGFLVTDLNEASPASKSDLRKGTISYNQRGEFIDAHGDIIVGIDGKPVRKIDDILTYLEKEKKVGENVILSVVRDEKFVNIEVKLGERPTHYNISQSKDSEMFSKKDSKEPPLQSDLYNECLKIMPKSLCDLLQ
jgi:S1-C subfamily serine protease